MPYRLTKRAGQNRRPGPRGGRDPEAPKRSTWQPPELRRVVEITDYDGPVPRVYRMELRRSDRIDCYDAYADGALWRRRIGWSRVLAGLRMALPRVSLARRIWT